ncbi:MAG: ABC transporter ATP-binding protein [Hyphomicrobiales bacterium]
MSIPELLLANPSGQAADASVVAEDLVKHFRSGSHTVKAVDGVSATLVRQAMVVVRGPSGCGKSTFLNLIGGLEQPDSGRLVVDGVDISRMSARAGVRYRRSKVGFVFQQFNLVPYLTALENVMLPLEYSGVLHRKSDRQQRAAELLRRVGLNSDRHLRRPSRLSGGEQQRVAIARALANDPPIIVADEPTANLDSRTGRLIIDLLRGLATEGRTVVVATHDGAIAARATSVIEMSDGRVVAPAR